MASASQRADEIVAKAEKRLKAWTLFATTNKHEDAADLYAKAANLYKAQKLWDKAGSSYENAAACHLKNSSAHEAATAYQDAANAFKKTDADRAVLLYKEAVAVQIDLGRFTTAAKLQKEIADIHEASGNLNAAMEAYQTAADYYQGEEATSSANQCLLKVAGFAAGAADYKRAIEIYEQVAISSLDSTLLKWSVKGYFLCAGICHLASGELGSASAALERYKGMDASFETTREGQFLGKITAAYDASDIDAFTDEVRDYDEISRLDPQKTSLLLEVKNKIKESQNDLT